MLEVSQEQEGQQAPMCAAIDIGSNTIHSVVARCRVDDLEIVADEVEMVRIGESVTACGAISPQKRDAAIKTLQAYKALAEQHGASPVFVVATEAIRKASNSNDFIADVKRETGLDVQLIDGNVEATLTFYGATYELAKQRNAPDLLGVMDLGGGSTELVTAQGDQISWRTSVPIGSGWLHDRYLPSNPPTMDEIEVAQTFLHTYLQGIRPVSDPPALIVTGGSATTLLFLARMALGLDEHEMRLTDETLRRCEELLHNLTAEEVTQRYQQPQGRAKILPAGLLIIRAVMERFHLNEIRVSPHGIREGTLLAYMRYGEHWLQQVQALAAGDGDAGSAKAKKKAEKDEQGEKGEKGEQSFQKAGYSAILTRTHKMLSWRDEVLKHEDSEAVHKMRVATRRLRAALDAYETLCEPKQFKKVYRRIKKMADILGNVRDTDVMIEGLQVRRERARHEEQAGIDWLIARLHAYRRQQQKVLDAFFKGFDDHAFVQQVEACFLEKEV